MTRKIALLSDVHGNSTALEAVLADAESQQVTDYWFLGDLLLPSLPDPALPFCPRGNHS